MSTDYYLKSLPEKDLTLEISKQIRRSLIQAHDLLEVLELLKEINIIENETVQLINRGVRGPYANGYYCGFKFDDEFKFWQSLITKFPNNGLLNIIYAEYLVQKDKCYDNANIYYRRGFDIDFRLIGFIESSWLDELTENNFEFRMIYLRLQKEQYEPEDFTDLVAYLKKKYKDDIEKINEIDLISAS